MTVLVDYLLIDLPVPGSLPGMLGNHVGPGSREFVRGGG